MLNFKLTICDQDYPLYYKVDAFKATGTNIFTIDQT